MKGPFELTRDVDTGMACLLVIRAQHWFIWVVECFLYFSVIYLVITLQVDHSKCKIYNAKEIMTYLNLILALTKSPNLSATETIERPSIVKSLFKFDKSLVKL